MIGLFHNYVYLTAEVIRSISEVINRKDAQHSGKHWSPTVFRIYQVQGPGMLYKYQTPAGGMPFLTSFQIVEGQAKKYAGPFSHGPVNI